MQRIFNAANTTARARVNHTPTTAAAAGCTADSTIRHYHTNHTCLTPIARLHRPLARFHSVLPPTRLCLVRFPACACRRSHSHRHTHSHSHTAGGTTQMRPDNEKETHNHDTQNTNTRYIASQRFTGGLRVHYSLDVDSPTVPIGTHTTERDRLDREAESEKQQLLRAIFNRSASDGPFSHRWYPLASVLSHLLPQRYPDSVNEYYLSYSKWVFLGSILGTASSVLSMQCLLVSLGLGAAALPASAAINWVLKDGLGQLGGMLFASLVSTRFDMQPIRYRLLSAAVLDASVLLEILTPLVPALFLPLASLANIGKNIAWLGASASRAAIHRSFLKRENLADLTAKSGSQTILASLGGTALGIGLSMFTGTETMPILLCFLMLSAGHLLSTYNALRRVVINHLTEDRLDVLSHHYLTQLSSRMHAPTLTHRPILLPSPAEIQRTEPIFWRQTRRDPTVEPTHASHTSTTLPNTPTHLMRPDWSHSSVDFSPRFDELVGSVIAQPDLMIDPASAAAAPSISHDPSHLYHSWVDSFSPLPFIASLEVAHESRTPVGLFDSLRGSMLRGGAGYARIQPDSNTAPPTPYLHIRILFKQTATSDDILQSSLYVNYLRSSWQRMVDEGTINGANHKVDAELRALHTHALAIVRVDSVEVGVLHASEDAQSDGASSSVSSRVPLSSSVSTLQVDSPTVRQSTFIAVMRASGYATDNPFVQDDNDTRVTLEETRDEEARP